VTFALEDCRHLTRRLEADLLTAGRPVVRVPTRLMAATRRSARHPGKSDPIDAEAVALAALRHPDLPVAALDGPTREVKLLVDYRRDLVRQRTRVANRLRWHLHELDPALQVPSRGLRRYTVIDELAARLAGVEGTVARLARLLLGRCRELTAEINALEAELRPLVRRLAPRLLAVPGCGVLGAAMILGETAGVGRFRSKDAYARFTGTARWRPARGRWPGRRRAALRTAPAAPRSAGPGPGLAKSPPRQASEHMFGIESGMLLTATGWSGRCPPAHAVRMTRPGDSECGPEGRAPPGSR
jgi:transposase